MSRDCGSGRAGTQGKSIVSEVHQTVDRVWGARGEGQNGRRRTPSGEDGGANTTGALSCTLTIYSHIPRSAHHFCRPSLLRVTRRVDAPQPLFETQRSFRDTQPVVLPRIPSARPSASLVGARDTPSSGLFGHDPNGRIDVDPDSGELGFICRSPCAVRADEPRSQHGTNGRRPQAAPNPKRPGGGHTRMGVVGPGRAIRTQTGFQPGPASLKIIYRAPGATTSIVLDYSLLGNKLCSKFGRVLPPSSLLTAGACTDGSASTSGPVSVLPVQPPRRSPTEQTAIATEVRNEARESVMGVGGESRSALMDCLVYSFG